MGYARRMVAPSRIRYDRIDLTPSLDLPPPRRLATGGIVYTMVLARPGVQSYPWGKERVARETLADPEWLTALAGVPVIDDDRRAHADGVDTSTIEKESIGRVLKAWWSDAHDAVLAEAVVDVARGLDLIRMGVRGVSPAYAAEDDGTAGTTDDGTAYDATQTKRYAPNNVAITLSPRGGDGVALRADAQESTMDKEEVAAMIADALAPLMERMDAMTPKEEKPDAEHTMEAEEEEDPKADRADSTVSQWRTLDATAKARGVDLDDGLNLTDARRAVAKAIVGARADSLDADGLDLVLSTAATVAPPAPADPWATVRSQSRADAAPSGAGDDLMSILG